MTDFAGRTAPFVTAPFTTTAADYLRTLIGLWLPRHGWKVALPILACAAIGIALPDERFLLIALMLLFIVVPMGMSFLYTYYMLTPEARRAVLRQQVTVNPGYELRLDYLPPVHDPDAWTADPDPAAAEPHTPSLPDPEVIPWTHVRRVAATAAGWAVILAAPRLQFILIPYASVPAPPERE